MYKSYNPTKSIDVDTSWFEECPECEDGFVTIYNAYDPDYEEKVVCSVCGGSGKVLSGAREKLSN